MEERFFAESPKDGKKREWKVIKQLGNDEFISIDNGEKELYKKGDEGYNFLLKAYKKHYGNKRSSKQLGGERYIKNKC